MYFRQLQNHMVLAGIFDSIFCVQTTDSLTVTESVLSHLPSPCHKKRHLIALLSDTWRAASIHVSGMPKTSICRSIAFLQALRCVLCGLACHRSCGANLLTSHARSTGLFAIARQSCRCDHVHRLRCMLFPGFAFFDPCVN